MQVARYPIDATAQEPDARIDSGTLFWLPVVLGAQSLDPTETLLLVALVTHIGADDMCFVGISKLAAMARVSYGTVRRRLVALETRGVIHRERLRRTDGNLSVYEYRLERKAFALPARNLRDDQRAPRRAMTSAHPGARAELSSSELTSNERPSAPKPTPPPDDSVTELCEHLAKRVAQHRGTPLPAWGTPRWLTDMRRLLERGPNGRASPEPFSPERVRRGIDRVFDSLATADRKGFCWADQIRSPGALREQWDQLAQAYKRAKPAEEERPEWMA